GERVRLAGVGQAADRRHPDARLSGRAVARPGVRHPAGRRQSRGRPPVRAPRPADPPRVTAVPARGRSGRAAWLRRRWLGLAGLVITAVTVLSAVFAPWVAPYDPLAQALSVALDPPGPRHWLGTDQLGRDMLSRLVFGGRVSLATGLGSV